MNIVTIILLTIPGIIILFLIIGLFIKKDYTVEREITINKDKKEVFDFIKMLKNQDQYNVWVMMDPNSKRTYKGNDGTEGFEYTWESENKRVGHGLQTIKKIYENNRIEFELHFIKPFEGRSIAYMTTDAVGENQTKLKWGLYSKMKYPMNIMLLFMNLVKMLGDDLSVSLSTLKKVLET